MMLHLRLAACTADICAEHCCQDYEEHGEYEEEQFDPFEAELYEIGTKEVCAELQQQQQQQQQPYAVGTV